MAKNNKNKNKRNGNNVTNVTWFRYYGTVAAASNSASISISNASTLPDRFAQMCNLFRYFKPTYLRVKTLAVTNSGACSCEVIPGSGTTAPAAVTNMESNNMQVSYTPSGVTSTQPFSLPLMDIVLKAKELQPLGEWLDVTGVGTADEEQIATVYWVTTGATDTVTYHVEFAGIFREPLEPTTASLIQRLDKNSLKDVISSAKARINTLNQKEKIITPK